MGPSVCSISRRHGEGQGAGSPLSDLIGALWPQELEALSTRLGAGSPVPVSSGRADADRRRQSAQETAPSFPRAPSLGSPGPKPVGTLLLRMPPGYPGVHPGLQE